MYVLHTFYINEALWKIPCCIYIISSRVRILYCKGYIKYLKSPQACPCGVKLMFCFPVIPKNPFILSYFKFAVLKWISCMVFSSWKKFPMVKRCLFNLLNGASQVVLLVKNPPANAGDIRDVGLVLGSGRSPGGRHGNPLQYSCLENPIDRGTWWATVHRAIKSQTWLKRLNTAQHNLLNMGLSAFFSWQTGSFHFMWANRT